MTTEQIGRLLFHAARVAIAVTAEDGSPVFDGRATVIALDNPDGRPVLVAVTDDGRELRIPVRHEKATAPVVALPVGGVS